MATVTLGVNTASTTDGTSYTTGSFTPVAGDVLIVAVFKTAEQTAGAISDTGQGIGWTKILSQISGSGLMEVFRGNALAAAAATTVTYSWATGNATSADVAVWRVAGIDEADDVCQAVAAGSTAGTTPSVTLNTAAHTGNPLVTLLKNGANPAAMTPPSGWTEDFDTGVSTPSVGYEGAHRDSGETGSAITWGASSATAWTAVVVELWTTIHATVSQAIAFTLSAAASVQVTAAVAAVVPFTLTAAGSVQVTATVNQPIPFALSAAGVVLQTITGTLNQPVPLSGSATASVQVTAALNKAIPFGLVATGTAANTVYGTLDQPVPISGTIAGSVAVNAALNQPLAFTLTASGTTTNGIQCSLNQPIPFGHRPYLPDLTTTLPVGITLNRLQDPLYGSPFEGSVFPEAYGPWPTDGVAGVDYTVVARITSQAGASAAFTSALASSATVVNPVIEVGPGITLTGPFTFPKNTAGPGGTSTWLEVRSTAWAQFTGRGTRFDAIADTAFAYVLVNQKTGGSGRAFWFAAGGGYVRIRNAIGTLNNGAGANIVVWADIGITNTLWPGALTDRPSHIVIEKCRFDQDAQTTVTTDLRRFFNINATDVAFIDTLAVNVRSLGNEAQSATSTYGAERVLFDNCDLIAAGECWITGGGTLPGDNAAWVPKDLEFRNTNFSMYPVAGAPANWGGKNLFELKTAERVLMTGCTLTLMYEDAQSAAVALKCNREGTAGSATQGGYNNVTKDITLWFNHTHHVPTLLAIVGKESSSSIFPNEPVTGIDARFWLVHDLNVTPWDLLPGSGNTVPVAFVLSDPHNVVLDHITIEDMQVADAVKSGVGGLIVFGSGGGSSWAATNLTITNWASLQATYGVFGTATSEGTPSLNAFVNGYTWRQVAMWGGSTGTTYPSGTFFPATKTALFPSYASGDYNVAATYQGIGTDGLDLGAIPAWVLARTGEASNPGVHAFLTKPIPFGLTATASVQVGAALNKPLPLTGTATASVQVTASVNQPIPFALSAAGVVLQTITGTLNQPVPLSGSATASVQVTGALNKAIPFGLVATGTAANTVYGTLDQPVPFTLTATASVTVSAALNQPIPFTLAADASAQVTATVDAPILFTLSATGTTLEVDVAHLRFVEQSTIRPTFLDVSAAQYQFTDSSLPNYRFHDVSVEALL